MPHRLRGEADTHLRLAAPATVLRNHLPALLRAHKQKYPSLCLELHDANQASAEALLHKQKIDIAITELEGKAAPGIHSAVLFKLPLTLVASRRLKLKSAAELWQKGHPRETLISLPPGEVMVKQFHTQLTRIGITWPTRVEVSAIDLVSIYTSLGFGIGLSVAAPGARLPRDLVALPLPRFPPLVIAVLWQKNLSPANTTLLQEIRKRAAEFQNSFL